MWRSAATADALERALSRRSARREVEESLHPLLDLTDELVSVGARGPGLRPEFRQQLHERLLAVAAEQAQQRGAVTAPAGTVAHSGPAVEVDPPRAPVPVVVVLGRSWRHAAAGVLASALVAVGTTATASTGAMPGDALYTVKRGIEDVQLHLVTSEADLGQLHLHRAERRLQETRVLYQRGDEESADRAVSTWQAYERELRSGTELLVAAHDSGDDDALEVLDAFRQERQVELQSQPDLLAPVLEEDVEHLEDVIAENGGVTADDGGPATPGGTPDAGEDPGGGGVPVTSPTTSDGTPSDSPTAGPSGSATTGSETSTAGEPTGSATTSETGTQSGTGTPTGSGTGTATGSGAGTATGSDSPTGGSSTGTPTGPSSSPEASDTGSPAPGADGVADSGTSGPSSSPGAPSETGTGSPSTTSATGTPTTASQPPTATAPAEDDGTEVVAAPGDGPRPAPSPSTGTESTTASHAPSSTASTTTSNPDADPAGPAEGEDGMIEASDTPSSAIGTSTETASVDVG